MQKVSEFISTLRNSKYLGLIAILVLVAIIPITVLVAQMNQDIRQRASELSISPISPPPSLPVSPPAPTVSGIPTQITLIPPAGSFTPNASGTITIVYDKNATYNKQLSISGSVSGLTPGRNYITVLCDSTCFNVLQNFTRFTASSNGAATFNNLLFNAGTNVTAYNIAKVGVVEDYGYNPAGCWKVNYPCLNASYTLPTIPTIAPTSPPAPTTTSVVSVSIFRLLNSGNGDHLYTANPQERDNAVKIGYKLEGIGFYAPLNTTMGYVPVYRFYRPKTGEHFYTADQDEANTIKKYGYTYGYNQEGIAFYASISAGTGLTPVYRFINSSTGFHFYTASEAEKNTLSNSSSYRLEGITFYTPITTVAIPTPVATAPQITNITINSSRTVTITGQNFINLPQFSARPQYVSVRNGRGGTWNMGSPRTGASWSDNQITFSLPSNFSWRNGSMRVYTSSQWSNSYSFSF